MAVSAVPSVGRSESGGKRAAGATMIEDDLPSLRKTGSGGLAFLATQETVFQAIECARPAQTVGLVDLPLELRVMIYKEAVPTGQWYDLHENGLSTVDMPPALAQTCHQLHNEVLPVFLSHNTFNVDWTWASHRTEQWLRHVGMAGRHLRMLHVGTALRSEDEDHEGSRECFRISIYPHDRDLETCGGARHDGILWPGEPGDACETVRVTGNVPLMQEWKDACLEMVSKNKTCGIGLPELDALYELAVSQGGLAQK